MPPAALVRELTAVARKLGIAVRFEKFDSVLARSGKSGGRCVLRGRNVIVVNAALPTIDQAAVLAEALRGFDKRGISIPPAVLARIEGQRLMRLRLRPLARARPRLVLPKLEA